MCAIAQREDGRLNQEIIRHNKELGVIRERRNNFEVRWYHYDKISIVDVEKKC